MRPIPLFGDDAQPDSPVSKIIRDAAGKTQILDAAPTAAANPIPEGERGYFNNKMYETVGGVLKEWAVSNTA